MMNSSHTCLPCRRRLLDSVRLYGRPASRRYTRPSFAPKPSIDIRHIRNAPGLYEQNCTDRNYKKQAKNSWRILELHEQWQEQQREARSLRQRNNILRKHLSNALGRTDDNGDTGDKDVPATREELLEQARQLKSQLSVIEANEKEIQEEIDRLAIELPNLSSTFTPNGGTPEVKEYLNDHPSPPSSSSSSDRVWQSHVHIGQELDLLDFQASATTSGWGWYFLKNEAALLEQALVQYALATAMKRGWRVVSPPSIIYSHIAAACGFQPRDQNDEQQIYTLSQPSISGSDKDRDPRSPKPTLCLAGTAEIPFAAMKANTILEEADLPLKIIGASRCYRAEAGARGVDTKGLYRVHEFTKVEMFAWTMPDDGASSSIDPADFQAAQAAHFTDQPSTPASQALFDEMVAIQKEILTSLGLHCRVLEMPTHDLGASATRKIDIEAFFPSRREKDEGWGEVTSASICTDYQTRRLATRVKTDRFGRKHEWPYTVNGTALAVPRVLAAIMEANWDEHTSSMSVPEVLRPWMGGLEKVTRRA